MFGKGHSDGSLEDSGEDSTAGTTRAVAVTRPAGRPDIPPATRGEASRALGGHAVPKAQGSRKFWAWVISGGHFPKQNKKGEEEIHRVLCRTGGPTPADARGDGVGWWPLVPLVAGGAGLLGETSLRIHTSSLRWGDTSFLTGVQ